MNDRTIPRAVRQGARTAPVEHKPRPKKIRGNISLTPDELVTAMEMARAERVEQQIRDYTHKKRVTA
jgi:hypothetical protein